MRAWWTARSERERVILAAAALVFGLGALHQLGLAPLLAWRNGADARAAAAEESYRLVTRAAAAAAARPKRAGDQPARNALVASASAVGVGLAFVNALPDGSVDFQTEPSPPERVFELIARLEREHAVAVRTIDIARAVDDPRLVRVQATLAR